MVNIINAVSYRSSRGLAFPIQSTYLDTGYSMQVYNLHTCCPSSFTFCNTERVRKNKDTSKRIRGRQLWGLDNDNTTMTTVMKNITANYINSVLESCWENAKVEKKGICLEKCQICIVKNLDDTQNKSDNRPLMQLSKHLKLVEVSI